MARSCRRLLAACSLIFTWTIFTSTILAAPILLRGQDNAADHSSFLPPVSAPKTSLSSYAAPIAPVLIPRPPDPPRYLGVAGNSDFQKLVFRQLVRSAGIIFSGRVTFIGHAESPFHPNPASTTVTFQVEHAIRGTSPGVNLTIHEWAGLWTSGERYRVGQRVLLFLYGPSKLGLTSPVAGALGKFTMDSQGQVVMGSQHVAAFAGDPILAGKTVVSYADFVLAVRHSMREE
ncbi:MAG: hypothetical protein WAK89_17420 [Candidatus Sulfotelmatobacter sp.]